MGWTYTDQSGREIIRDGEAVSTRVRSVWTGVCGTAERAEGGGWTIRWDDGAVDTEVVSLLDPDFEALGRCEWFALCENPATHFEAHTILGAVPCCERCASIARGVI